MTFVIDYFGQDLKNHVVRIDDYWIASTATYYMDRTVDWVVRQVLDKLKQPAIASINDVYYEDD